MLSTPTEYGNLTTRAATRAQRKECVLMLRGHARPPAVGRPELGGSSPWTLRPYTWFSALDSGTGLGHGGPIAPVRSLACLDPESLVGPCLSASPEMFLVGRHTAGRTDSSPDSPRFPAGTRWEHRRLAGYSGWTKDVSSVSAYEMQKSPLLVQICHIPLPCNDPKASSWATCVLRRRFG